MEIAAASNTHILLQLRLVSYGTLNLWLVERQ